MPTRIVTSAESAPHVVQIRADQIVIDDRVQRQLIPARLKKLSKSLDLDALGVITVSARANGEFIAIDGQHRLAALIDNDLGEWEVTCNAYRGLTLDQEAALFRRLNDTRKISQLDDFKTGIVEGDLECMGLNKLLEKHGLKAAEYGSDGTVTCIRKLRDLYKSKDGLPAGENLDETLEVSMEAWGRRYAAVEKSILGGLAFVLRAYPDADRDVLVKALTAYAGGPTGLLSKARLLREIRSASVERLVAAVIVEQYNKKRRRGKLASL